MIWYADTLWELQIDT